MAHHARLAPSNTRWPNCPGSVREEAAYPDVSSEAAIDGTGSHLLLEMCVAATPIATAASFIGRTIGGGHPDKEEGWLVDEERAARVQIGLDYIQNRIKDLGPAKIHSEVVVNPGSMFDREDWYGTSDVILEFEQVPVLEIIDYKDGYLYVDVENSQMIGYAAGALKDRLQLIQKNPTVRTTIVQPKIENKPIRTKDYPIVFGQQSELGAKAEELAAAAARTDDPNAPLHAGDWCRWCKHLDNCKEYTQHAVDKLQMMVVEPVPLFEEVKTKQLIPADMPSDILAKLLDAEGIVTAMFENVRKETMERLERGETVPGYIIGEGRSSKTWIEDLDEVDAKLKGMQFKKDERWPTSFVSPAQALKKKELSDRQKDRITSELIVIKPGKKTLVKSSREQPSAEELFAGVPAITSTAGSGEEQPFDPSALNFL